MSVWICSTLPHSVVYQELGDGQVLEAVEKHIERYASHCARETRETSSSLTPLPDLILFQQAMEHATRLCRAMVGGGHPLF